MSKVVEEEGPPSGLSSVGTGTRLQAASKRLEFLPGGLLCVRQRLQDGRRREEGEPGKR